MTLLPPIIDSIYHLVKMLWYINTSLQKNKTSYSLKMSGEH
jgi:hypothetical protein